MLGHLGLAGDFLGEFVHGGLVNLIERIHRPRAIGRVDISPLDHARLGPLGGFEFLDVDIRARFVIRIERHPVDRQCLGHTHIERLARDEFDACQAPPAGRKQRACHAGVDHQFGAMDFFVIEQGRQITQGARGDRVGAFDKPSTMTHRAVGKVL